MKFSATVLLALATSVLSTKLDVRGGSDDTDYGNSYGSGGEENDYGGGGGYGKGGNGSEYGHGGGGGGEHVLTKTLTTYSTLTTCPVTSTYTKHGSTYYVTQLTTSTIVVTKHCHNCGVVTVQGPGVTKTAHQVEYSTYTTVCPVTETKTIGGKETTVTYTTTKVTTEEIKSTAYAVVKKPGATKIAHAVAYSTYTTVCPVTETKTISGKETTLTYTTTKVTTEEIQSTAYAVVKKPGATKVEHEVAYSTYTAVYPVTETKTISGKPTTVFYTTTEVKTEKVASTAYAVVKKPGETYSEVYTVQQTETNVYPVTKTKYVGGKAVHEVYTTTEIVKKPVPTTVYVKVKKPNVTKTRVAVAYVTHESLYPVTETKTEKGHVIYKVYTTTSYAVEKVKTTVYEQVTAPNIYKTAVNVAYVTHQSLYPVTETQTVHGQVITKVYTTTSLVVEKVKTTIPAVKTIGKTVGSYEVHTEYSKKLITVGGGTVYETHVAYPKTVHLGHTEVVSAPQKTYKVPPHAASTPHAKSAPSKVHTAAAAHNAPAAALVAGVFGALALF